MDKSSQILDSFRRLAGQHGPLQTLLAKVLSVNEQEATCVLKDDDGFEIFDVRLKPIVSDSEALLMIPALESWVLAARIEDDEEWTVLQCEQADKVRVTVGESVIEMTAEGIKISKSEETLKSILSDILSAIKTLTVATNSGPSGTPLNAAAFTSIENRINNFLK